LFLRQFTCASVGELKKSMIVSHRFRISRGIITFFSVKYHTRLSASEGKPTPLKVKDKQ